MGSWLRERRVLAALIGLPLMIAALVVGGALLGLRLAEGWDPNSRLLLPVSLATLGFVVSVVLAVRVAEWAARGGSKG
jgi:hypothetical protein